MTAAGTFEIQLFALQLASGVLAAWGGMRIVDDLRKLIEVRRARSSR